MTFQKLVPLALALALGAVLVGEQPAEACGGCFIPPGPPGEDPAVVTDHRMILSVAQGQTTLYDQIRYRGLPEEFAWVLPIAGEAEVGLSADTLFSTLGGFTQTQIVQPPQNCPPQPNCSSGDESLSSAPQSAGGADPAPPPVIVTRQETVGPYATVQLQSENAEALNQWLADNKFIVPADVKPIISQYVKEHFNFLAMKLKPGANVQSMRPVRVTTKGPSVVLPLRMVAAGTGAIVGITLWVVGEGRYAPQNFPSFSIKADDLVWDWNKSESNYKALRGQRTTELGGRGWEIESAFRMPVSQITQGVRSFSQRGGPSPQGDNGDYTAIPAAENKPARTAEQAREEDLKALFGARSERGDFYMTRLRADLVHASLAEDLVMSASVDQGPLPQIRQVTKEANEPLCPVWNGCDQNGYAPRSEAARRSSGPSCSSSPSIPANGLAVAGLGLAGLALVKAARRRREG